MNFFLDFLHQKVPADRGEIPTYYRRALTASEILQAVYFLVCFFLYPVINHRWEWVPLVFIAFTGICLWAVKTQKTRTNLILYAIACGGWVFWNVQHFGWSSGVQHFLTLMLVFVFFNVYDKPLYKILWLIVILAFRILLFSISQRVPAIYNMDTDANTIYQTVNTVAFFLMLAGMCIIFSTSIQDTERQLRLKNQSLYKEAGTDPLTGLPNRRAMIEQIEKHYKTNGDEPFSMPGLNLDDAGVLMKDLCFAVEKMQLEYEEHQFSITITIGVEEYDFASPLEELLNMADEKLYMGKNAGRNRVVV